jgi:hypothetical protein
MIVKNQLIPSSCMDIQAGDTYLGHLRVLDIPTLPDNFTVIGDFHVETMFVDFKFPVNLRINGNCKLEGPGILNVPDDLSVNTDHYLDLHKCDLDYFGIGATAKIITFWDCLIGNMRPDKVLPLQEIHEDDDSLFGRETLYVIEDGAIPSTFKKKITTQNSYSSLDMVLAALYDCLAGKRNDLDNLLAQYKAITGKNRPGFMG